MMTLCLWSQLNPQCSHRVHKIMTRHFSLDFICTRNTSAGLFCLSNMRIISHLFIYLWGFKQSQHKRWNRTTDQQALNLFTHHNVHTYISKHGILCTFIYLAAWFVRKENACQQSHKKSYFLCKSVCWWPPRTAFIEFSLNQYWFSLQESHLLMFFFP